MREEHQGSNVLQANLSSFSLRYTSRSESWANADAIGSTTNAKSYSRVAAVIFSVIALLQLFRALAGWEITLNGAAIPLWASWLAAVVAGAWRRNSDCAGLRTWPSWQPSLPLMGCASQLSAMSARKFP
jgi:hypothetical protein